MKQTKILATASLLVAAGCVSVEPELPTITTVTLSKAELKDKIKGAWAAQTIGVTFGAPYEFKYNSVMIPDYVNIPWDVDSLAWTFENLPGVYDDIYIDLSFIDVLEKEGMDAPASSFAEVLAHSDYSLWFANQQARFNVLNGMSPPQSGHWLNNPSADDIDFQIEADFIGIMHPGMVNSSSELAGTVGQVMNYGDGWYGGVYVAALYSTALVSDDVEFVVSEALRTIPVESKFHQVISDVIRLHKENPDDWKATWFEIHKKWSEVFGTPWGVFGPFNIDAKINSAWVVLGLLYGNGEFSRTFEIATRAGDDADCNPATAGGVLAAIKGYEAIPEYWKSGLPAVEALNFPHTELSLNDAYRLSYEHALEKIETTGGQVTEDSVTILLHEPRTVPSEVSFAGQYPTEKILVSKGWSAASGPDMTATMSKYFDGNDFTIDFNGVGFAILGWVSKTGDEDYIFETEVYIDDVLVESPKRPTDFSTRSFHLFWKYQLEPGDHNLRIKTLNPTDKAVLSITDAVIYTDKPKRAVY